MKSKIVQTDERNKHKGKFICTLSCKEEEDQLVNRAKSQIYSQISEVQPIFDEVKVQISEHKKADPR